MAWVDPDGPGCGYDWAGLKLLSWDEGGLVRIMGEPVYRCGWALQAWSWLWGALLDSAQLCGC